MSSDDAKWMNLALEEAVKGANMGEVPVGAVLVSPEGTLLAASPNTKENESNPLGHAELNVIREASWKLGRWRLSDCTLYVTLEPCVMCAGAIVAARLGKVVYGARDPKTGAVHSIYQVLSDARLNHRPDVESGVMAEECGQQLVEFFKKRRIEKSQEK